MIRYNRNIYRTLASPLLANASEFLMFREADDRILSAQNILMKLTYYFIIKKNEDISAELQIDRSPDVHKIITFIRNTTQVCNNNNIQEQNITLDKSGEF